MSTQKGTHTKGQRLGVLRSAVSRWCVLPWLFQFISEIGDRVCEFACEIPQELLFPCGGGVFIGCRIVHGGRQCQKPLREFHGLRSNFIVRYTNVERLLMHLPSVKIPLLLQFSIRGLEQHQVPHSNVRHTTQVECLSVFGVLDVYMLRKFRDVRLNSRRLSDDRDARSAERSPANRAARQVC